MYRRKIMDSPSTPMSILLTREYTVQT